jgi:hypothetical protein
MSNEWWLRPEFAWDVRSRPAGACARGPGSRGHSLGYQLGPDDRDLAGGIDSEPDLTSFQPDDSYTDVVADKELFHQLPRQHQHGTIPRGLQSPFSASRPLGTTIPGWGTLVAS